MPAANTSSQTVTDLFNDEIFYKVLDLSQEDKNQIFQMLTIYVGVLYKVLDAGNHPILDHISGTPNATLEALANNGADISGVDYEKPKQLIAEYDAWKSNQTK